jgi:DNA-binding MarR family transcriptional regulator
MELRRHDSLGYQVNLLARLFERALRERIAAHGVVPGQFPALLCLYEQDGLTQAEIGSRVQIEQPTIAKTLQRMERDGLIRRAPDPDDRRRVRIHLTPRTRALEPTLAAAARAINERAIDGLTRAEAEHLMGTVTRIIANLGGRRQEADGGAARERR